MSLKVPAPGIPYLMLEQKPPAGAAVVPQPDGKPIPKLFQPLKIRGVEFQNRIFVESPLDTAHETTRSIPSQLAPLCQYSADNGIISSWHLAHLGGILTRGPGLTFVEATGVVPEGRISPQCVGIWSDAHAEALSKIVEFSHSQGQKIAIQLAHSGRKGSTTAPWLDGSPVAPKEAGGWPDNVWGPSTVPFSPTDPQPKELTLEGIKNIVNAFAEAAKRAVAVGFDVIEVHSAHGYLLSSFLSPTSNKRTDTYGGSFENRIRLTVEVVDAIRAAIPKDTPLFVRISGTEWLEESAADEPSWRIEDTARIAPILAEHGVDLLDVSGGGIDLRQKIRLGPEYQVPFATAAKEAAGGKLLVGAVGGLSSGKVARDILESNRADVIFVGRQFQKNPGQVWAMADEIGIQLHHANQIGWGFSGRGGVKILGSAK